MRSRDPMSWMWAEACEMLAEADRLHRQFFRVGPSQNARPSWEPPTDIFESEHEILICIALPGVSAEHVRIGIEEGGLVVVGERPMPFQSNPAMLRRLEIPHGRFERRISFPAMRLSLDRQEFLDGCLLLSLRKN
jgi:HSP20 family protein